MIYVFLAEGFEESEGIVPVDIMRRAGLKVTTLGVGSRQICASHGIIVQTDALAQEADLSDAQLVVLPGGMPGTLNLDASDAVDNAVKYCCEHGIRLAAICAAPLILGRRGLLEGKNATCYPGFENELAGATVSERGVVTDGLVTTARSAGYAMPFGLELVRLLCGDEVAAKTESGLMGR